MRKFTQLTLWDRRAIAEYRSWGWSLSRIAAKTGYHRSSISRELQRNVANNHRYYGDHAQHLRNGRNEVAMVARGGVIPKSTQRWIRLKLQAKWSPEQIAGRSGIDGPQKVSHEYIYRLVRRDREMGGDLYRHLRRAQKRKYRFKGAQTRSKIPNRVDISTRPKVVEFRSRLGDLEGDLIVGKDQLSHIVVTADRRSRLVGIERIHTKTPGEVNKKLQRLIKRNGGAKTLTLDNGLEFSRHRQLTGQTGVKVYFAHAYAAWERGTVENMNGLLRQFLPKKTDFRRLSRKDLRVIEDLLNNRPRKCLAYKTPKERHRRRQLT